LPRRRPARRLDDVLDLRPRRARTRRGGPAPLRHLPRGDARARVARRTGRPAPRRAALAQPGRHRPHGRPGGAVTALLVALGAALGAVGRHLVTTALRTGLGATPAGAVLVVNASGSLVLGLVAGHCAGATPGWLLPLVGVGFCGA